MLDAVSAHAFYAQEHFRLDHGLQLDARLNRLVAAYGLSVKSISPTSALLFSADACIDPMTRTIRLRRDLDTVYRREILAHEIAHVILGHEGVGLSVQSRAYIGTYGRNERIERLADNLAAMLLVSEADLDTVCLQCNSFDDATEFLGVSTATLVRRLTQHQSPVASDKSSPFQHFSYQLAAIEAAGNVCIEGGVGTGKTEVLFERLRRIALQATSGHSRLLFVTYLRRHMVYLFEKLTLTEPLLAERVHFTTFHDYAADIVLRNYASAGWSCSPSVVGRGEIIDLLQKLFPEQSLDQHQQLCSQYTQTLRNSSTNDLSWKAILTEQLYKLNYVHNGSLSNIAAQLMELTEIENDESDRWDAIFIDNYEQLTYQELTILRLAGRKARFGLSCTKGYSGAPYCFRGVTETGVTRWVAECHFSTFDFELHKRLRPSPSISDFSTDEPVPAVIDIVRRLMNINDASEKIIVAVRHNVDIRRFQSALIEASLHLPNAERLRTSAIDHLYELLDLGMPFGMFLNHWWQAYCTSVGIEKVALQHVLTNAQMYGVHCERGESIGLPKISIESFLDSVRPHHQYRDIHLSQRVSVQTLHSLSGCEIDHLVIILDFENPVHTLKKDLNVEESALLENAMARATRTVTIIHPVDASGVSGDNASIPIVSI